MLGRMGKASVRHNMPVELEVMTVGEIVRGIK